MVVLNASLSSFSSGYCCASIAGAILFLQQDTKFFPPSPPPVNHSGYYGSGYGGEAAVHSCFHHSGTSSSSGFAPSSSSSSLAPTVQSFGDFEHGLLVSCILLSALVGALCASSVADIIGRRPTQIFMNLFFIVGCAGMYFSPNNLSNEDNHGYLVLVGARSIAGLGVGFSSVLVNLYISEISPAKSRGELGGWAPFAVTAGILVSYIIASFLGVAVPTDDAWRYILGFGAVPAFLQMAVSLFFERTLPESPRWLLAHGRPVAAYQASILLHGANNKNAIQKELDDILLTMMQKQTIMAVGGGGGGGNRILSDQHTQSSSPYGSQSSGMTQPLDNSVSSSQLSYSAQVGLDRSWNGGVGGGSTTLTSSGGADGGADGGAGGAGVGHPPDVVRHRSDSEKVESEIIGVQGDVEVDCCCRLCSRTRYRSAALAGIGINILQQVSGINVVIYFGPLLLKETGFNSVDATALTAGVSVAQLIAVGVLMRYVDSVGRRPMAFLGLGFMIVGLSTISLAFFMLCEGSALDTGDWAWTAVVGMLIFRIAFSLSLGPLPYIVTAEVFPNEVRACGATVSWSANWIANFGVTLSFPLIKNYFALLVGGKEELGSVCLFGIYIFFSFFAVGFIYRYVPETAKRSLDDL
jgi:MFS family permease